MKLFRYGEKGREKPGVLFQGKRKDCSGEFEDWNRAFFQENGLETLRNLLETKGSSLPDIPEDARFGSCIARPGMIMCIGLNYSDHAKESNMTLPAEPIIFGKATNTLAGPNDDVPIPRQGDKTDYEVELGVILKKDVTYLKNEAEGAAAIAGYCIVNDLSERAFQLERGGQWIKGKSCPGFSPVGPYLVTPESAGDTDHLDMELKVNGAVRQKGNTQYMVFKPAYLIYYLSQFMTLEAGDLISTGTPAGVALGMNPPAFLKKGDVAELTITGLGKQQQQYI